MSSKLQNSIQRIINSFGFSLTRESTLNELSSSNKKLLERETDLKEKIKGLEEESRSHKEKCIELTDSNISLQNEVRDLIEETQYLRQRIEEEVRNRNLRCPVMDEYERLPMGGNAHAAGAFPTDVLKRIEDILPASIENSAETGCGKSTILFSNISKHHKVFTLDDTKWKDQSSLKFFNECPITKLDHLEINLGPTQKTLLSYQDHAEYDVVLIDGPHGFPFPELEYWAFYPHIKKGGYLILDDVCIPSIARLADIIAEDEMFELVETINATSVFRRTEAETFDPYADGWWTQRYNRRRVSSKREIFLNDGPVTEAVSSLRIDDKLHGGS